jgi:hypothetical protein
MLKQALYVYTNTICYFFMVIEKCSVAQGAYFFGFVQEKVQIDGFQMSTKMATRKKMHAKILFIRR